VRCSTKLPARPDTYEAALAVKRQIETELTDAIRYGIKPSPAVGVASYRYLGLNETGQQLPNQGKVLGPTDRRIMRAAVREFGMRRLDQISNSEWSTWLRRQNAGNGPASLVRYSAPLRRFLRWCADPERGWLAAVPSMDLPRLPRQRHAKRRRVADLRPDLLVFLFSHAPIHLSAQLYTEWSTAARVSSVLFGCRLCDLILAEGRSQITFHNTKNGDAVTAFLHPAAAEVLTEYLEQRGHLDRREGPLFLTDQNKPYSVKSRQTGWGGQNKTSFRNTVRRAVKAKRREAAAARIAGDRDGAGLLWADAALLAQVTQHWLRHWFATHAMAQGMDLHAIGEQGGWRDYRSIQAYQHDVPEVRRRAVERLPIGGAIDTFFARDPAKARRGH
jgi:integrase